MKTIKQWFETLPTPANRRAIYNAHQSVLDTYEPNLHTALKRGFVWNYSREGQQYWNDIYEATRATYNGETAVNFLRRLYKETYGKELPEDVYKLALFVERQQIIDAHECGSIDEETRGADYYDETFKITTNG